MSEFCWFHSSLRLNWSFSAALRTITTCCSSSTSDPCTFLAVKQTACARQVSSWSVTVVSSALTAQTSSVHQIESFELFSENKSKICGWKSAIIFEKHHMNFWEIKFLKITKPQLKFSTRCFVLTVWTMLFTTNKKTSIQQQILEAKSYSHSAGSFSHAAWLYAQTFERKEVPVTYKSFPTQAKSKISSKKCQFLFFFSFGLVSSTTKSSAKFVFILLGCLVRSEPVKEEQSLLVAA